MDSEQFRARLLMNLDGPEWVIISNVLTSGNFKQAAITEIQAFLKNFEAELTLMIHGRPFQSAEDLKWILDDEETREESIIELESCGKCSKYVQYALKTFTTKVIVGKPSPRERYHAVSYVWGQTRNLELKCKACNTISIAPFESAEKFRRLMRLTDHSGEILWLDALSVDQAHGSAQKQEVLACMGQIYEDAQSVRVFLPKTDESAYRLLAYMSCVASEINVSPIATTHFDVPEIESLTILCRIFNALCDEFEAKLSTWTYWQRVWTFQEWALAAEVSISLDKNYFAGNFHNIKGTIITAATYVAAYKIKLHQYSSIDFGYSRGLVVPRLDTMKRLFPDEKAFFCAELIAEDEFNKDIYMATFDFSKALCLREVASESSLLPLRRMINWEPDWKRKPGRVHYNRDFPSSIDKTFLERLAFTLRSLGMTKRSALYQADLVASWASMCNITYDYKVEDTLTTALSKVLGILRRKGIKIYNFHVSTSDLAVDSNFLEYAPPHRQSNAQNKTYLHGLPILNGRCDTLVYFRNSVMQPVEKEQLPQKEAYSLRTVLGASIVSITNLDEHQKVISEMSVASRLDTVGTLGAHNDVRIGLYDCLKASPPEIVGQKQLVVVRIPAKEVFDYCDSELFLWTICPKSQDISKQSLVVGRESLNKTLVLAGESGELIYEPLAYLVLTDNMCGTYLVPTSSHGHVSLWLHIPARGDRIGYSANSTQIALQLRLAHEESQLI